MKSIILYSTKYGATKKYVDFLVEETKFDCIEVSKIKDVKEYDTIILCGPVYMSKIKGISFIHKNYDKIKDKKIAVFGVGASLVDEATINELKTFNKDLENFPLFYGRGALNEEKMSFKDRTLCKLLRKAIAKQNPNTYSPIMKVIASADKKEDWIDKKYIKPLLDYIMENK